MLPALFLLAPPQRNELTIPTYSKNEEAPEGSFFRLENSEIIFYKDILPPNLVIIAPPDTFLMCHTAQGNLQAECIEEIGKSGKFRLVRTINDREESEARIMLQGRIQDKKIREGWPL